MKVILIIVLLALIGCGIKRAVRPPDPPPPVVIHDPACDTFDSFQGPCWHKT